VSVRVPQNVLVADDEPSNLLALEAILEPLGHRIVRAESGEEVLRRALHEEFSVILLDVQMPGMDGFECAELLRKRASTRDVPIIFLTAISKDRSYVRRGYGVGAVDYLVKPYDPDVLRSKVSVFTELERRKGIIAAQQAALRVMKERELADLKRASEERYVHLADAMPLVVWTADPEGHVRYANRSFRDLCVNAPLELPSIVHPDDLESFLTGWQGAVAEGRQWEAELRFGTAAAGYRVSLVRAVPARGEGGRVAYWLGMSMDIHARVRAERAVRMLADASRGLAASFEDPSQMDAVLRAALPILGDAAELLLEGDRRVRVVADGADGTMLDDPRFGLGPDRVRATQRSEVHFDVRAEPAIAAPDADGAALLRCFSDHGVSSYLCVPLASRGDTVGTLTLLRMSGTHTAPDVTIAEDLASRIAVALDNARLHETTERRRVALEQANRSKDVFLATLSHELRTPLNAIVGWSDMMRAGQLSSGELPHAIETIDRNAHALSDLVADLLDVSRIVTGTLKLESKLVGIATIVDAAVETARPQCAAKDLTLDVALAPVGCARGDAGRLRQVLGNVLSNAVKFTPPGGRIIVRTERVGDRGRVVVRDTGEGISRELLPHVFDRFRQAETAKARGLGLGLAIVKHLVEEHGGKVSVASDGPGCGAELTVELPIAAEEGAAEDDAPPPAVPSSSLPALQGVTVLVVEDDPDGNELITTILQRYGANVRSVGTASAALDALAAERPAVLVSDIGLPDMDGIALIKQVRAEPRESGRGIAAIALTAYASRQDAAKALAAGFDAHVAKPVQPLVLGRAILRLLARPSGPVRSQPAA
jgi:PAS domain S-box-containing protein